MVDNQTIFDEAKNLPHKENYPAAPPAYRMNAVVA